MLNNLRINVPEENGKRIRPWHKKNPDIVTITATGEVTVFECKTEANFTRKDIVRMAQTYITIQDFAGPFPLSDKKKKSIIKNNFDKWRLIYRRCYEKESRFPSFQDSLENLFLLRDFEKKQIWAEQAMKHIKGYKYRYIVAYKGDAEVENIQTLVKNINSISNDYNNSFSNLSEKLLFLSISSDRKIRYIKPASAF